MRRLFHRPEHLTTKQTDKHMKEDLVCCWWVGRPRHNRLTLPFQDALRPTHDEQAPATMSQVRTSKAPPMAMAHAKDPQGSAYENPVQHSRVLLFMQAYDEVIMPRVCIYKQAST